MASARIEGRPGPIRTTVVVLALSAPALLTFGCLPIETETVRDPPVLVRSSPPRLVGRKTVITGEWSDATSAAPPKLQLLAQIGSECTHSSTYRDPGVTRTKRSLSGQNESANNIFYVAGVVGVGVLAPAIYSWAKGHPLVTKGSGDSHEDEMTLTGAGVIFGPLFAIDLPFAIANSIRAIDGVQRVPPKEFDLQSEPSPCDVPVPIAKRELVIQRGTKLVTLKTDANGSAQVDEDTLWKTFGTGLQLDDYSVEIHLGGGPEVSTLDATGAEAQIASRLRSLYEEARDEWTKQVEDKMRAAEVKTGRCAESHVNELEEKRTDGLKRLTEQNQTRIEELVLVDSQYWVASDAKRPLTVPIPAAGEFFLCLRGYDFTAPEVEADRWLSNVAQEPCPAAEDRKYGAVKIETTAPTQLHVLIPGSGCVLAMLLGHDREKEVIKRTKQAEDDARRAQEQMRRDTASNCEHLCGDCVNNCNGSGWQIDRCKRDCDIKESMCAAAAGLHCSSSCGMCN